MSRWSRLAARARRIASKCAAAAPKTRIAALRPSLAALLRRRRFARDSFSCSTPEGRPRRSRIRSRAIRRKPHKRKVRPVLRVQYAALPYRFTSTAALEILLVTARRSRRWIIPKGWPIKGLKPPKSAAREAFEEAGVRGKVGMKSVGVFNYDKLLAENGIPVNCEVRAPPALN